MAYRLGIDVGGTFTDLLLYDDVARRSTRAKVPSTPRDRSLGVLAGIEKVCSLAGVKPAAVDVILHGTTVATNTVLEGNGARVGLIVTDGFQYILHLAKSFTPGPLFGWIIMDKPDPLASLDDTREVMERLDPRGTVVEPLDRDQARAVVTELTASGIEALTVSLLHAYANPDHEQAIGALAAEIAPDLPVSLSSDILPEFREYERTITTVMNAYVRPRMRGYLAGIERRLRDAGLSPRLHIVRSDGGLMSAAAAEDRPVHTILSGPSGGVNGSIRVGRSAGHDRLLTFDMGGTSTDVAVVEGGEATVTRETQVGYFPVKVPSIDVRSIGAGGGSVATVAEVTGALRVGPRSAGAEPGPACYGRGGTEPTVTDANVVLGYLPPSLLDGEMTLDEEAARQAVATIAESLGLSVEQAARGILDIVNENMLGALRVVTVQRGLDPRQFALLAFGGAGPLHANALAAVLGCYPVIVPPAPGVLSAVGFVASEFKNEFVQTTIRTLDTLDAEDSWSIFERLAARATSWLDEQQIQSEDRQIRYNADLRYRQQGYEVTIDVPAEAIGGPDLRPLVDRFEAAYERLYGYRLNVVTELVALRATGVGRVPALALDPAPRESANAQTGTRRAYFDGWVETPVYDRARLAAGSVVAGPAIVTQYDSTTVILPGHAARVDDDGNLLIDRR